MLEISSLIIMNNVLVLECHDRLADLRDVLVEDLSFQDGEEFWEVVHDLLPVAFSDRVARALGVRSVNEDLTLVEADVESVFEIAIDLMGALI